MKLPNKEPNLIGLYIFLFVVGGFAVFIVGSILVAILSIFIRIRDDERNILVFVLGSLAIYGSYAYSKYQDKMRFEAPCTQCGTKSIGKPFGGVCEKCVRQQQEESERVREQEQAEARAVEARRRQEWFQRQRGLKDILNMSGSEFERFVGTLYEQQGYEVRYTPGSGDDGVDLFLVKGDSTVIVQCKNWSSPVGVDSIRQFFGVMVHLKHHAGYFIATSGFSTTAKEFAKGKPIQLLDSGDILRMKQSSERTIIA